MPPNQPPAPSLSPETTTFSALILGAGPAGLQAALTLSRQARTAAIFTTSKHRNDTASHAHNILGHDHVPPASIRSQGRKEVAAYGTTRFVHSAVLGIRKNASTGAFEARDAEGTVWRGRKVVVAMGVADMVEEMEGESGVEGLRLCWGKSVWQCFFCDGLERGHLHAGVLGTERVGHFVGMVARLGGGGVTVFKNGGFLDAEAEGVLRLRGVRVEERRVREVRDVGGEGVEVVLEDGVVVGLGFLAAAPRVVLRGRELLEGLGVEVVGDGFGGEMVKASEFSRETSVEGVFVAGDAGTPFRQVVAAVYHGAVAGAMICMQLLAEEEAELAKQYRKIAEMGEV
ncbi:hypothetical protein MBLNU230_g3752t1 [Neophaeotheca triangularis]